MRWIYILKCSDEDLDDEYEETIYYVGQTKRLYSRFWEHNGGKGGINTSTWIPQEIVAIYKVSDISKFITYNEKITDINNDNTLEWTYNSGMYNPKYMLNNWDDIDFDCDNFYHSENNIAECLMVHNKDDWKNIRGGKYVRFDCNYKFPNNNYIKELPLCDCGLPCDVKKNKNKNNLYFRCAKKNMWDGLKYQINDLYCDDEPCSFYREYLNDIELRVIDGKRKDDRKIKLKKFFSNADWLDNVEEEEDGTLGECICCNKYVWSDRQGNYKNNGIEHNNRRLLLCFDCFIDKNEQLKQKYDDFTECLV